MATFLFTTTAFYQSSGSIATVAPPDAKEKRKMGEISAFTGGRYTFIQINITR